MERATKEALTRPRLHLNTEEVPIEGVGTVLVRGLSRKEMIMLQRFENDRLRQDAMALHLGLVEPPMSEADVADWQAAGAAMEIERVAQKINKLSGIGKDAAKSGVSEDGDGSEPGV